MAMRIVLPADDIRLIGRSLEKRAWFMGRFIISTPRVSFDRLRKYLDSRNEVETVLRLSDKGISWGKNGFSWWRPRHRTLPFTAVELSALHDIFQETSKPQVLICVQSPVQGVRDSNCMVFVFRLYDIDDVTRFQRLFQLLTNAGGTVTENPVRLDNGERSPKTRLAVRTSLELENKPERGYGDTIRHGSRRKNRNSTAVADPNNNAEKEDRKAGDHQMIRSISHPPTTTSNRLEYYSPQPIRRQNRALQTGDIINHQQMTPETVPIYSVAAARTETGRPVPATRTKVTSKSWSDDEDAKKTVLDLTWTRNSLFSDKVVSRHDGELSKNAAESDERPTPKPRARNSIQERTVTPTQVKSYVTPDKTDTPAKVKSFVTPEMTVTPTQVKRYVTPDRTGTPTQVKSHVTPERTVTPTQRNNRTDSSDNTSERTITPTQMRDQLQLERAVTPTGSKDQTPLNVYVASAEDSPGLVRVFVPDYQQSPAVPHRSLLKARKDPESNQETTTVEPGRQKKSLSFNPSVLVNETTGNSLSESESQDQPDMDVTDHKIFRHRHASWSDSSTSEGLDNMPTVRNRGTMRGLSLPNGHPTAIVSPSAVRIRTTADQTTTDSKPHAAINDRHGSSANHDHTPLDQREQVSEKKKVRIITSRSMPEDVITELKDRMYERRSTTQTVTDQPKGNKTGPAASSKGHRRMGYFGRRSGEPPLQYASDIEESARSRSTSNMLLGQGTRRGVQVVHQPVSPVVIGGGGHPSMAGEATVMPNGRLEVRIDRVRKESEKTTVTQKEGAERIKEIGREEPRRGRSTQVREGRRREVEDEIRHVPVTHDRHSDPVGRQHYSSRSKSAFDPRRVTTVVYNPDIAPPNGYLSGQQMIRSRSATRPILLSRTISHEEGTTQMSVPAGWHQKNGGRNITRYQQYDLPTTQLHNGGVSGPHQRRSNYF